MNTVMCNDWDDSNTYIYVLYVHYLYYMYGYIHIGKHRQEYNLPMQLYRSRPRG